MATTSCGPRSLCYVGLTFNTYSTGHRTYHPRPARRHDLRVCGSRRNRVQRQQQPTDPLSECITATERLVSLAQRASVPVGSTAAVEALSVLEDKLSEHITRVPLPRLCSCCWALARLQVHPSPQLQESLAAHLLSSPAAAGQHASSWSATAATVAATMPPTSHTLPAAAEYPGAGQQTTHGSIPGAAAAAELLNRQPQQQLDELWAHGSYTTSSSSSSSEPAMQQQQQQVQRQPPQQLHLWNTRLVVADPYSLKAIVYSFNAFGYKRLLFWGAVAQVLTSQLSQTKSNVLGNMLNAVAEVYYSSRGSATAGSSSSVTDSPSAASSGMTAAALTTPAGSLVTTAVPGEQAGHQLLTASSATAALDTFTLALSRHLLEQPEALRSWRMRDVADLVGALAVSAAARPETQQLLMLLAKQLLLDETGRRISSCRAGDAATIAWGFVHCGVPHVQLLQVLARHLTHEAPQLHAPDLGKLLWAYATAGVADQDMLAALSRWASEQVHGVNPRVAATVVWACGKLRQPAPALVEAALDRLSACLEQGLPPQRVNLMGVAPAEAAVHHQPSQQQQQQEHDQQHPQHQQQQQQAGPASSKLQHPGGSAAVGSSASTSYPGAGGHASSTSGSSSSSSGLDPPQGVTAATSSAVAQGPSLLQQLLATAKEQGDLEAEGSQKLPVCTPVAAAEPVVNPEGLTTLTKHHAAADPAAASLVAAAAGSAAAAGGPFGRGALCTAAEGQQTMVCAQSTPSELSPPSLTWAGQPGDVAHALWGAGRLMHCNRAFLVAATAALALLVPQWSDAQLVGGLWGLARVRWYPGQLAMGAFEQQILSRVDRLTSRQLAMVNWSCAALRHDSLPLLTAICSSIITRIEKQQQMAADGTQPQPSLLRTWQQQPFSYVADPEFDFDWSTPVDEADELAVLGLTEVDQVDQVNSHLGYDLDHQPSREVQPIPPSNSSNSNSSSSSGSQVNVAVRRDTMAPLSAVICAWSAAWLHPQQPQLFKVLAQQLLPSVPRMGPGALCQLLWAFATAGQLHEQLWAACYSRLTRLCAGGAKLHQKQLMQLFQADVFLRDAFQGVSAVPVHLPRHVAAAAEQQWLSTVRRGAPSSTPAARRPPGVAERRSRLSSRQPPAAGTDRQFRRSVGGAGRAVGYGYADTAAAAVEEWVAGEMQLEELPMERSNSSSSNSNSNSSMLSQEVLAVLQLMGLQPQVEVLTRDGLFSLDMVVTFQDKRVAVEVDGPTHFSANRPYQVLGPTIARRRSLAARGYYICSVPFYKWRDLGRLTQLADRQQQYKRRQAARQQPWQQAEVDGGLEPLATAAKEAAVLSSAQGGAEAAEGSAALVAGVQAQAHVEYLRAALEQAVRTPITAWIAGPAESAGVSVLSEAAKCGCQGLGSWQL